MVLGVPRASAMQTAFAYLGTECCLFMEIAMHELTVLPRGDLTAVDGSRWLSHSYLGGSPAPGHGRQDEASSLLSHCPPVSASHHPRAETRRQSQRSISLRGVGAPAAHLPLVPMQQGRPLILQSMCNKPVWLLWACSVQI